jgi:hypothetical protein
VYNNIPDTVSIHFILNILIFSLRYFGPQSISILSYKFACFKKKAKFLDHLVYAVLFVTPL